MSGLHEVDCAACDRHYEISAEQARKQRVLRCSCGQFVRLDRAFGDGRSAPAPAELGRVDDLADQDEDDEETHMLDSLAAVAALRGSPRARGRLVSRHTEERPSQPAPASGPALTRPRPASKYASAPPTTEKPLWYVDLGGSETVEMTIEQLIIARRSGKLGEGALVWRQGMPRWRPVGTLIPATSVSSRPAPEPAARSAPASPPPPRRTPPPPPPPPPVPTRSASPVPTPFASYERPLATLEFALDAQEAVPARAADVAPAAAAVTRASRGREDTSPRAPSKVPSAPPAAVPALVTDFNSVRPALPPSDAHLVDWLGERPRWVSACMALLVCVVASGLGAFLVRSLRHRPPLALATSTVSQPLPSPPKASTPERAPVAAASAPLVVDLESLSVEHVKPRARTVPLAASKPLAPPEASSDDDASEVNATVSAPASSAPPQAIVKPTAVRSNPSTQGAHDDSQPSHAPGSDEPGF